MQRSFIAIELTFDGHLTSRRMLSKYPPFCVKCKQTHTSWKI